MPTNHRHVVLCEVVALLWILPGARPSPNASARRLSQEPDITITMREYAFDMDSTLSPGRHVIALRNVGRQRHLVFLMRLAPGKTSSDVGAWLEHRDRPAPGEVVVSSAEVKPNGESTITVDLAPGRYSVVCTVRGWWNRPHFKSGMSRDVVVTDVRDANGRGADTLAAMPHAR